MLDYPKILENLGSEARQNVHRNLEEWVLASLNVLVLVEQ